MKQIEINLKNVSVEFIQKSASNQSFKNLMINTLVGGRLSRVAKGISLINALNNISLTIKKGERLGIVGSNGAGKSTLLRIFSGIYQPTSGMINISGKITSLLNIGLGINPDENGIENIKLRGLICGMTPDEIDLSIEDIINFSGLGNYIYMPFRTYSSGMQMRLAFAVATAASPQILILDEWLSLGDKNFQEQSKKRMHSFVSRSDILIFASHSEEALRQNCNRLIWLEKGCVIADGEVTNVFREYSKNTKFK